MICSLLTKENLAIFPQVLVTELAET